MVADPAGRGDHPRVPPSPRDEYLAAQRRRIELWAAEESAVAFDEPGLFGWAVHRPGGPGGRLFVHAALPVDRLATILDDHAPIDVTIVEPDDPQDAEATAACARLLDVRSDFASAGEPLTAMMRSLDDPVVPPLPAGLTVRQVRRTPDDDQAGVPLEVAAAAAMRAEPSVSDFFDLDGFVAHLGRAGDAVLLAALDADGEVRATSGASFTGPEATIYFVTTDPAWRGRGIGTAMTARALAVAAERGSTQVCLEASTAGHGIYLRLGFREMARELSWDRQR
jgi:ribosomal protein S18 acetylase RimI-like enzyme